MKESIISTSIQCYRIFLSNQDKWPTEINAFQFVDHTFDFPLIGPRRRKEDERRFHTEFECEEKTKLNALFGRKQSIMGSQNRY